MRGSCLVKKITESAKEIVYILCFIVIITDCLFVFQWETVLYKKLFKETMSMRRVSSRVSSVKSKQI